MTKTKKKKVFEKRAWAQFEDLVTRAEQVLLSAGAVAKIRDHLPDLQTGTPREVDATIRFKNGSSEFIMVLECRDRSRSQDVSWLEQLYSKKQNLGIDKLIAVSANGFSEEAKRKAKQFRIEVRTLKRINEFIMGGWLYQLDSYEWKYSILDSSLLMDVPSGKEDEFAKFGQADMHWLDRNIFRDSKNGKNLDIRKGLESYLQQYLNTNGNYWKSPITMTFNWGSNLIYSESNGIRFDVTKIEIEVQITEYKTQKLTPNETFMYSDEHKDILQGVEYTVKNADGKDNLVSVHQIFETGEMKITVRNAEPTQN